MSVECFNSASGKNFTMFHGDSAQVMQGLPDNSVDHIIHSIPFGDLFCYSDSVADLGNCSSDDEFFTQYGFIAREQLRVMKPGRVCAVHCSDLPTRQWKDGYIGLKPFSDKVREAHEAAGFIFYRRVTIWKCPVTENARSHCRNLGYSLMKTDSSMSAPGLPDYLMIFRKPGENAVPITHTDDDFPLEQWREWASPVWMTIDQGNVLGGLKAKQSAREDADERHVCPLQLDVIQRSLILWSNPGEVVLSPFAGIGSEGYGALKEGRKFVGIELKGSYFKQAVEQLHAVENQGKLQLGQSLAKDRGNVAEHPSNKLWPANNHQRIIDAIMNSSDTSLLAEIAEMMQCDVVDEDAA